MFMPSADGETSCTVRSMLCIVRSDCSCWLDPFATCAVRSKPWFNPIWCRFLPRFLEVVFFLDQRQ